MKGLDEYYACRKNPRVPHFAREENNMEFFFFSIYESGQAKGAHLESKDGMKLKPLKLSGSGLFFQILTLREMCTWDAKCVHVYKPH